jgi:hypothetical protein
MGTLGRHRLTTAALAAVALCCAAASPALAQSPYEGAIHEHTAYSDGEPGTRPADVYSAVRDRGSDFAFSTDHSDTFELPIVTNTNCLGPALPQCAVADQQNPADSVRKWDATAEQADVANADGAFTATRGFEWTDDRHGHINVLFSRNYTNAKRDGGYASMDFFWNWFTKPASQGGGDDGLATFNHPGRRELGELVPGGFIAPFTPDTEVEGSDWNGFEYVPAADARMVGLEAFNGSDYGDADDIHPAGSYGEALDKGWHVGAIGAEDTHNTDWGLPARNKTVILASSLTRAGLREALVARRFYAIRHAGVRMTFTANGQPMGSRLNAAAGDPLSFEASSDVPGATLELVTSGGAVVQSGAGSLSVTRAATAGERWYFVRVRDADGQSVAYSSPVWVETSG